MMKYSILHQNGGQYAGYEGEYETFEEAVAKCKELEENGTMYDDFYVVVDYDDIPSTCERPQRFDHTEEEKAIIRKALSHVPNGNEIEASIIFEAVLNDNMKMLEWMVAKLEL